MIVLVAGMPRSGSTFSFNIARDVLLRRGSLHQENAGEVINPLLRAGGADHLLLKSHELDDVAICLAAQSAVRVICTIRRPEDAAASWITTFGFTEEQAISTIKDWLRLYSRIRKFALTIDYETIDKRPVIAAHRIGRFLFRDAGWAEARAITRRHAKAKVKHEMDQLERTSEGVVDLNFSWYDAHTFFHRRHVSLLRSRSAEEILPREQAERIRAAFVDNF